MSTYYTLLTMIGAAEFVNAKAANITVPFTHLAVGDGNGAAIIPAEGMKSLVREVHRVPISSITADVNNPNWLVIEAVLPTSIGGWTVREVGLIGGAAAKLLAVGNFPDTYKPQLAEGSARDIVIRMIIQVGNTSVVQLTVDPSVALATSQSIANAIAAHVLAVNPHPQYALVADLAAHMLAADPHSQYATDADLQAHLQAIDPHSQYLNAARYKALTLSTRARRMFFGIAM